MKMNYLNKTPRSVIRIIQELALLTTSNCYMKVMKSNLLNLK